LRILKTDFRKGLVRVKVEDVDDLWVIKNVIKEGDIVVAKTLRDIKLEGEGKRRKAMTVALRVKNVYFQPFATRLRIHGVIVDAPEGYGLRGSHHTLNIDVGLEFDIIKKAWNESLLNRLRKASSRWVRALLVAADFDEASFAVIHKQGVRYLLSMNLPGINERDPKSIDRVAEKVAREVLRLAEKENIKYIVIGSPVILRELIVENVKEGIKEAKVYSDSVSIGGKAGIEELLRRDSVKNLLKEATAVEVQEIFNEFLTFLSTNPLKVATGLKEVMLAAKANAIEKLLVLEDLLTGEEGEKIEELINDVELRKASVRIVPSETPVAPKLRSLGGLVAILRYPIDFSAVNQEGQS